MPLSRRIRIPALLSAGTSSERESKRLCDVCAEITRMSGAAIVLLDDDAPQGTVCATSDASARLERLQFELGEGPCIDAHYEHRAVFEPDLARPLDARWPAFARPAVEAGARAVFAFPLHVGAAHFGALQLHRDRPGGLSDDQYADALVVADVAARAILVMQSNAPLDQLAAELEVGGDFRYVVHQASGMVAAQLDVSVAHAGARLRAYAFENGRPIADVAADVVARTLRLKC